MDMFVIEGGRPLCGTVAVRGEKLRLPLMAAPWPPKAKRPSTACPRLVDVDTLSALLETLGMGVARGNSR